MRRSGILGLVCLALLATACGTRVSDEQVASEAREDARRLGQVASLDAGDGGTDTATGAGEVGAEAATGPGATGSGDTGVAGPAVSGAARGTASGTGGVAAPAPAGGNGGATDVGVTANELKVGWVGTLTGPVPGLFRGALIGTQAFMAYQNSQGGLFGRRLRVLSADDGLDSGKNRAGHLQLKDQVFAFVGSFSVNDDGGVSVLRDCRCPDVNAALTRAHLELPTTFSPQPTPGGYRSGGFVYFKQKFPQEVIEHTAFFSSAVPAARPIANDMRRTMEGLGYRVVYSRELQPNETNFTGDVIQMRNTGTRSVMIQSDLGNSGRLASAMREQNFSVDLLSPGNTAYDPNAFRVAGDAFEGALIDQVYALFLGEDAEGTPEVRLFLDWMKRVDPSQTVDLFAMYGWISGRLFVEAMQKVGPQATRAKVIDVLSNIGAWDGNGMVAPVNVGQKRPSDCVMIFTIKARKFSRVQPADKGYDCGLGPFKPA